MQLSTKKAPTGIITQLTDRFCCGVKGLPVAHSVMKAVHYRLVSQLRGAVCTFLICHGYPTMCITPNLFLPLPLIQVLLQDKCFPVHFNTSDGL